MYISTIHLLMLHFEANILAKWELGQLLEELLRQKMIMDSQGIALWQPLRKNIWELTIFTLL